MDLSNGRGLLGLLGGFDVYGMTDVFVGLRV
jgi:hypothetical protein